MKTILLLYLLVIQIPLYTDPEFPNFALYDVDGKRQVFYGILKDQSPYKIFVLNFTSVDCVPCKKEIPELIELEKKNPQMKLFCIFNEAGNIAGPVGKSLGLPNAYSDPMENIQKIFGVKSYPTTVVLGKQGKVLATLIGYNEENTKQLKKLLEK
jgi:thiol-disulfide isomerase/thioredoxin